MPVPSNRHASDETLEQYSMGRLSGSKLDEFEEHLLTCAPCQDRLASTDACIGNIRSAAAELARQSAANRWFHKLFDLPGAAWAFGLAAVGLAIAGREWRSLAYSATPPRVVVLQTTRGSVAPRMDEVPAGRPLILMPEVTGLQPLSPCRLEIVDESGHQVFQTYAVWEDNELRATVGKGLWGGEYYVRVYGSHELLREYVLEVR